MALGTLISEIAESVKGIRECLENFNYDVLDTKFYIKQYHGHFILLCPNGMIYIEDKFDHAVVRMDLVASQIYGKGEMS